jgi:hypothetical protein
MAADYLTGLLARREELVAAATEDLAVPRWDNPKLVLRVKPIEHRLIRAQTDRVAKTAAGKQAEAEVDGFAAMVAAAVEDVLIGEGKDQARVKLYDLKEALGFDPDAKVEMAKLIRTLCVTDGDVISLGRAVVDHSGYKDAEVDEALAGE